MSPDSVHHLNGSHPILALPFAIAIVWYVGAALTTNHSHRRWPYYRYAFWFLGVACAALAVVGPLANRAHLDFSAHMAGHILLGMAAPLFIALAAPMTLLLRKLKVQRARRLSRMLQSWPVRFISHPVIAATLNIGGLWLLYMSDLYVTMQQNFFLHLFIQLHVFAAGYLFTASMIYVDPAPHRFHFVYRSVVFIIALAGHGILSKCLYAAQPAGVSRSAGESGAMLMYYGGDMVDILLIFILCLQWYKATRPPRSRSYTRTSDA